MGSLVAFAVVVHTGFFQTSTFMLGDIAYHRGVANTMLGGDVQGDGPYRGFITYYGGLFPLSLGLVAGALSIGFDNAVTLASWIAAALWPLALLLFARRLWPGDAVVAVLFALLGTVAGPFDTSDASLWASSVLPSGADAWPLFPRDVALVLLLLAIVILGVEHRVARVLGVGVAIGVTALFHIQLGIVAALLVAALLAAESVRTRAPRPVLEAALMLLLAAAVSSWWWIPRLAAFLASGTIVIADYQGRQPLRVDPVSFVALFGPAGIIAVATLILLFSARLPRAGLGWVAIWLAVLLPLVLVDRVLGGNPLLSERRVWLLAAIPILGLAAVGLAHAVRRLRAALAIALVVLVIAVPAIPAWSATVSVQARSWRPAGEIGATTLDAGVWFPIWGRLRERVRATGDPLVVMPDAYAAWAWSFSGVRVFSLWLPGAFKLGFDPEALTGLGYLERVALLDEAFARGRPGLCALGEDIEADAFLLDRLDGLIGTFDATPAARYRGDPAERASQPIRRPVAPRIAYLDRGIYDSLRLERNAEVELDWRGPEIRAVTVEIRLGGDIEAAVIAVTAAGKERRIGRDLTAGTHRLIVPLADGASDGIRLRTLRRLELLRVTGYERVSGLDGADGPFVVERGQLCRSA